MSSGMAMVVYRGWDPEVFLEPVPESSARFHYVFLWTVYIWNFESIYDSILLKFAIPVLGVHEKSSYGVGPFKMNLDTQAVASLLEPAPSPWMKGTTMKMFLFLLWFDPLVLLLLHWLSVDVVFAIIFVL